MSDEMLRVKLQLTEELLSKPKAERNQEDIVRILPWIRHQSSLFKNLEDDVLVYVIKHVTFVKVKKDHLILKQGDKGNCFYVIIKGSVSVYARKEDEQQIDYLPHHDTGFVRGVKERLAYFGTELGSLKAGSSFGEMVLTSDKKERNATVIADEVTELISIDGDLYMKSFYAYNQEWKKKSSFVQDCPLFSSWPNAFKDLLIENLKLHKIRFGNRVVEQRSQCSSVYFIARGAAKVMLDPCKCKEQYEALAPRRKLSRRRESLLSEDKESLALNELEDLARPLTIIEKRRRRLKHGFVAMETRLRQREIQATTIGPNDLIGDVEMILELPEYCASVECVETLEVYQLDKACFHRLIVRRNPGTLALLLKVVITKLTLRVERFGEIPLCRLLLDRAISMPHKEKIKSKMKKKEQMLAPLEKINKVPSQRVNKTANVLLTKHRVLKDDVKSILLERKGESVNRDKPGRSRCELTEVGERKGGLDKRRSKRKVLDAPKKQYTLEEFRELKKKMQTQGKLIGRVF